MYIYTSLFYFVNVYVLYRAYILQIVKENVNNLMIFLLLYTFIPQVNITPTH